MTPTYELRTPEGDLIGEFPSRDLAVTVAESLAAPGEQGVRTTHLVRVDRAVESVVVPS